MRFANRKVAGKLLAQKLTTYKGKKGIVLAIPRGGVIVGAEIARELKISLDLIIPRKIGAPHNPEFALGAVTYDGTITLNPSFNREGVSESYVEEEAKRQIKEIERRLLSYRGNLTLPTLKDKIVFLTDDGIATGSTVLAAIKSIERQHPKKIILAIPVAPADTIERMKRRVDEVVCLYAPELFYAVGQFYDDFSQVPDEEVIEIMEGFKNG